MTDAVQLLQAECEAWVSASPENTRRMFADLERLEGLHLYRHRLWSCADYAELNQAAATEEEDE